MPRPDGGLVGRRAELAALERFLDDVSSGGAPVLVLAGEPGIGKSELFGSGVAAARGRGHRVLVCRPAEPERELAYTALGDLLDGTADDVLTGLSVPRRQALATALMCDGGGEADRRGVMLALTDALRTLAGDTPVVVAVDDLQWLDRSSSDALAFALRRLGDRPVGVLATVRPGCAEAVARLEAAAPGLQRLTVSGLDDEDLGRVVERRLGERLLPATLRRIHATAGGNPLFALELVRALGDPGGEAAPQEPLRVSPTLGRLLDDRLAGLSDELRTVLLLVAALSKPTVSAVERAAGAPRARALLADAVAADVLEAADGRLRFTHPLLASVVYAGAGRETRRRVHGELAAVVDEPEERARHLGLAAVLPDARTAAVLEQAARRAAARGAPSAAAGFARRAAALTPGEHPRDRVRRAIAAVDHLCDAGETAAAAEVMVRLTGLELGDEDRARLLHRLARATSLERGFVPALALLEQACAHAGANPGLAAAIERDLSMALMNCGEPRRAVDRARSAVRAARAAEDRQLVADAEIALTTALFHVGEPVPEGLSARMSDVARRRHEAGRREPAWFARAVPVAAMLKWSDEFDRARTAFEACRSELQARDEEGLLFPVLFQLGELECWAGDLGAARRWTADAAAVGRRAGQPGVRAQSLYLTALVGALAGDVEAARAQAAEGLAVAETIADLRLAIRNLRVLGLVELSLGDPGRARPYLLRAVASADRAGYGEPGIFRVDGDAIETLVAAGELAHAERRSGALRAAAERLGRTSALAVAGRCAALLESARGAPERALVAAESALAHHARGHEPLERGRTLLVKGTIERRLGRRRVARGSLEAAHAAFAAVGAPLWAGRARAELARVPGRAPATGEVTPTERRVAELVAVGRTNREVAAELFLSMSAVEANLSRVYRKLGVRSRTELAVRLAHGGASPRRDPAAS